MATDLENLAQARSNLIAALRTESLNPKPSYSINGQAVSWNEYRASLIKSIEDLANQIATESGPYEVVVEGIT